MLLLIPGPVQTRPEVRAAMAVDIAPWDRDFFPESIFIRETVRDIAGGLPGVHVCLPLQGAGHFITEAAIRTFIPAEAAGGGKLLIPVNGAYSERMSRLAREAGRAVVEIPASDTEGVDAEVVRQALEADPAISHVGLVYSETGSGIINDVPGIGAVVRAAGRRMIVDAVSAFGALPFSLEAQPEVDAVVFTSNKCIEGLPGMGFAVCPIARVEASRGQANSWSFDLADVYDLGVRSKGGSSRFTPPVQSLHAFALALKIFVQEGGQPARLARYQENCRILYEGAQALGLRPYLTREQQGPIIALFHQPQDPNFELQAFVDALKARGVLISNFYNTEAPTMRIGCIGDVHAKDMHFAVAAMRGALEDLGVRLRNAA